ncbi:MAG: hypothetical protein ACOX2P_01455 [Bacillota bacterium]
MGLLGAEGSLALRRSADYSEYIRLVSENSGKFDPEQFAESKAISEATEAEYRKGNEDGFYMYLHRNPVQKFHSDYTKFGKRVHEYWNGPEYQDQENIMGVYPIQEKLKELSDKRTPMNTDITRIAWIPSFPRGSQYFRTRFFGTTFSWPLTPPGWRSCS